MDTKKKIAMLGGGFIGSTLYKTFSQLHKYETCLHDIKQEECRANKELENVNFVDLETAAASDFVFVALPTPMNLDTGECHTGFVESAVANIRKHNKDNVIVIKSTVPPGTTEKMNFSHGNVIFNPEFLKEKSPYEDFTSIPYQILGAPTNNETDACDAVSDIFHEANFKDIMKCTKVFVTSSRMAEMTKYVRNTYLATRLSFFNEIKQISDKLELDYDSLRFYAGMDKRVGHHYNKVEDGNRGFGGHCLVKDLNEIIYLAKQLGVYPEVLEAAWEKNLEVREHKDWLEQTDRAVIKGK